MQTTNSIKSRVGSGLFLKIENKSMGNMSRLVGKLQDEIYATSSNKKPTN